MTTIKIAVVSDLHAYFKEDCSINSYMRFGTSESEGKNPLINLIDFIKEEHLKSDILVCPGDICNQADISGFKHAWMRLHELNKALESTHLLPTCGNHDLNSRYIVDRGAADDPDPKGGLLSQKPRFPFDDLINNNQYWAHNFVFIDITDECCALILNTSAYHGLNDKEELEHGRISKRTIDAIEEDLTNRTDKRIYILICHHHIVQMTGQKGTDDDDHVKNGLSLLNRLERITKKTWLVIHGHRHKPRLIYGQTATSCAPIIFGSSSLGAQEQGISNQFHLIELKESKDPNHSSIVGTIKTWSWTQTTPWSLSSASNVGLPAECGFGFKGQIVNLAEDLYKIIRNPYIEWKEATAELPSLNFLTPDSKYQLIDELKKRNVKLQFDEAGSPSQLGLDSQ
ncbi:metallophosphoesterase [bacterium]|nr:metallophosphoesterase [bacterium]